MLNNPIEIIANISNLDFTNKDLSGIEMQGCYFRSNDLTDAKTLNADFTDADLSHTNMLRVNGVGMILRRANCTGVNFTSADLDANLIGIIADGANFTSATLPIEIVTKRDLRAIVKSYDSETKWIDGTRLDRDYITGISQAHPAIVTSAGHGLTTGDRVHIQEVLGMIEINDLDYTITVIDNDRFSLDGVNSTAYNAYVSGGIFIKL